jgi:hypothetical protein
VPALIVSTGGRPARLEGGRARRRRQGDGQAALDLPQGARHVGGRDGGDRAPARHPMLPFVGLAAGRRPGPPGAWTRPTRQLAKTCAARTAPPDRPPATLAAATEEADRRACLKMDDLKIEIGYALVPLVNSSDGTDRVTEQIKASAPPARFRCGFVMPRCASSTTSSSTRPPTSSG